MDPHNGLTGPLAKQNNRSQCQSQALQITTIIYLAHLYERQGILSIANSTESLELHLLSGTLLPRTYEKSVFPCTQNIRFRFSCFREVNKFGLRIEFVKRHLFHLCGSVQIIECFVERNLFVLGNSKTKEARAVRVRFNDAQA